MATLAIECPDDILAPPGQTKAALEKLAQEAFLVRLYDLGQISSGRAAEILQVPRRAFLDLVGQYGVSAFDEQLDLETEAARGR
jgi:predicted HTH domain antitoxin